MSEEMAVGDKATGAEPKVNGEEALVASAVDAAGAYTEETSDPDAVEAAETPASTEGTITDTTFT